MKLEQFSQELQLQLQKDLISSEMTEAIVKRIAKSLEFTLADLELDRIYYHRCEIDRARLMVHVVYRRVMKEGVLFCLFNGMFILSDPFLSSNILGYYLPTATPSTETVSCPDCGKPME